MSSDTTGGDTTGGDMTRREALRGLVQAGVGAGAAMALPRSLWAGQSTSRLEGGRAPNLVFVLTDDQPWDAMGFLGRYPFLHTPNMDRLAREGANFTNTFVTTSLCCPSRASFLTGCYAHTHGVLDNTPQRHLPASPPNFGQLLQQAGYETAFIGKWHIGEDGRPRPGFDHWISFKRQGVYFNPTLNRNGKRVKVKGYITDILTREAIDWLNQPRDKPFCLFLSHKAVHHHFKPAPRHKNAFPDATLPDKADWYDNLAGKPRWQRRDALYSQSTRAWARHKDKPVPPWVAPRTSDHARRTWNPHSVNARLDQLRCLLAVDEGLGKLLQTLEQSNELDETCVMYSSDNGYFFFEHDRTDKRLGYEESMRIPLVGRYPKRIKPGTTIDQMVLNIDLSPTLLDLAGARPPKTVQGRSFVPLMTGKPADGRRSFLYEYFPRKQRIGDPLIVGMRSERWKYLTYPTVSGDINEMYDLKNDPHEMHNLVQDPAHADRKAKLQAELARLKKQTGWPGKADIDAYRRTRQQMLAE